VLPLAKEFQQSPARIAHSPSAQTEELWPPAAAPFDFEPLLRKAQQVGGFARAKKLVQVAACGDRCGEFAGPPVEMITLGVAVPKAGAMREEVMIPPDKSKYQAVIL
jgi:hypothetical protein